MRTEIIPLSLIPPRPGTYVLIVHLASPAEIEVGKLGACRCPAGWYAYVGSALGTGGLAARVIRHAQQSKRPHWHIDYLLAVSELTEIWWVASPERWECAWAQALRRLPGTTIPLPGFGSSDCRCPAHLLHFVDRPSCSTLATQLRGRCVLCLTVLAA